MKLILLKRTLACSLCSSVHRNLSVFFLFVIYRYLPPAWGNEDTKKIIDVLKKKKVYVTFFMTGGWIEKYPDDVKALYEAGHELGNHSENHKQMSTLSAEECKEELMKPHEKVKKLTGVDMQVFRPPYGDYNDTLIETANA